MAIYIIKRFTLQDFNNLHTNANIIDNYHGLKNYGESTNLCFFSNNQHFV